MEQEMLSLVLGLTVHQLGVEMMESQSEFS